MTTFSPPGFGCPDSTPVAALTVDRDSFMGSRIEVYEGGEKLLDVYAVTWDPVTEEALLCHGEVDLIGYPRGIRYRYRNSRDVRLVITVPGVLREAVRRRYAGNPLIALAEPEG